MVDITATNVVGAAPPPPVVPAPATDERKTASPPAAAATGATGGGGDGDKAGRISISIPGSDNGNNTPSPPPPPPEEQEKEKEKAKPKPPSVTTTSSTPQHDDFSGTNPLDFSGSVDSTNELPSASTLARIGNYMVLDRDGKSHPFRTLYTGKHVARRVLVIFVRHFYCGNCQEYLRALSQSITPESLLRLPISTFIAVVGCGDPGLIDMYASETGCPFPIYADPTRKLYEELGMLRTLALGERPAYTKQHLLLSSLASVVQGLKQIKNGLAAKGGDAKQIGGEFLFEPLEIQSPVSTPWNELKGFGNLGAEERSLDGKEGTTTARIGGEEEEGGGGEGGSGVEEKRVTWCHRMRTTRDHAEIPELMEVLGLDGQGVPIDDKKRWVRAVEQRKGTGLSLAGQMSALKGGTGDGK